MISARMKPRSMSLWILPAACGALVPLFDRPGADFFLAGGQERHQPEQVVGLDDELVEAAPLDPESRRNVAASSR